MTDELRAQTDTRQLELWSQEDIVQAQIQDFCQGGRQGIDDLIWDADQWRNQGGQRGQLTPPKYLEGPALPFEGPALALQRPALAL